MIGTQGTGIVDAAPYLPFLLAATVAFPAAQVGHPFGSLGWTLRLALVGAAAVILLPGFITSCAGGAIILAISAFDYWRTHNAQTA
jgi:TRAP-type uncharacterized transport system fused permease subunit